MVQACLKSKSKKTICPLLTNNVIVAAMNTKIDTLSGVATPVIPRVEIGDVTIVSGTKEMQCILEAYEAKFRSGYSNSIVTRKKGKLDSTTLLPHSTLQRMRPSKDRYYRVDILELHSVITTIIKEF